MNELKTINFDTQTVSARELHENLKIETPFHKWFPRMCEYGFTVGTDFWTKMSESTGGRPSTDYEITLDMAKELCMIQRTPEGKKIREQLIALEKAWNTPEQVMARALKLADQTIDGLKIENKQLKEENELMKPKALFADGVSSSNSLILIRDFAKILRQNGVDTGERRLYDWLRDHKYICKNSTMPTQKAMDLGIFKIVEGTTLNKNTGTEILTRTTKVTGKGQLYLYEKLTAI